MRAAYSRFRTKDGRVVTLRPLRRGDLEALVPFINAFHRERRTNRDLGVVLYRRMTKKDEKQFLEKTMKAVANRKAVSVAAVEGGRIVGHCDVSGRVSTDERHTGVLGIIVSDGYRGVGLGEEMMKTALAEAARLGIWMIELEVFANNAQARRLYEKLGFKVVGVIPKKILRDGRFIDIVCMYTHLPHN